MSNLQQKKKMYDYQVAPGEECEWNTFRSVYLSVQMRNSKTIAPILKLDFVTQEVLGAIQVLRNADGGGGQIFQKKALRRCKVQCY